MSASPNSPWISPEQPAKVPPKHLPEPPKSLNRWPIFVFLALAVAAGAWCLRPQSRKAQAGPAVTTVRASRGVIQATRRLAGSITARRYRNVGAPVLQAPDTGRGL